MTIIYVMITIISFRYVFEILIIITRGDVNDLNMFRIISIVKINVTLIMTSELFKFNVVNSEITIGEM